MLARRDRIAAERDYRRIYRSTRPVHGHGLTLRAATSQLAHHRFGFIVSNAVAKRANVRNRLKRQLRHASRTLSTKPPYYDAIIIAHPPALNLSYQQLQQELVKLWASLASGSRQASISRVPNPGRRY